MVLEETLYRRSRLRLVPRSLLRTVLEAQELVGVCLGLAFIAFRDNHGKLGQEFVDARLDRLDAADAEATARLLRERLEKLPERRRPFYTPRARFQILALKHRNGWSAENTARRFALSANTQLAVPGRRGLRDGGLSRRAESSRSSDRGRGPGARALARPARFSGAVRRSRGF